MNKKVLFKIDKDLDFQNHLIGVKVTMGHSLKISSETSEYYKKLGEAKEKDKRRIFDQKTLNFYKDDSVNFRKLIEKQTQEMWDLVNDEFFHKMDYIHKNKFPLKVVHGILSTTPTVYGYDFNRKNPWFACSIDSPIKAIHTAMHEIMHVYFLEYFADEYKNKFKLDEEQIYIIKESLTVILNLEFNDIRIYKDNDKVGHEMIREKIKKDWLKYKDFKKVLEGVCLYIKTI